jgi:hypothetical protein
VGWPHLHPEYVVPLAIPRIISGGWLLPAEGGLEVVEKLLTSISFNRLPMRS